MNRTSVYTAYIIEIIDIFKQGGTFGENAGGKTCAHTSGAWRQSGEIGA
jgi:hypothetical protein